MSEPKIDVTTYGCQNRPAPTAAEFREGATDIAEINEAIEARLELSREPVSSMGRRSTGLR
jgi:hypothetical protein